MNSPRLDDEAIFHIARMIEEPEARAAYLEQVCGGDRRLRSEVEGLLSAHNQERSFLEAPPVAACGSAMAAWESATEAPGVVIGPYKLREQIGEGGMGTVYMAEQTVPVRRNVALKLIKPGMDSRQVIARFEGERQALAMMDHPNIARVFDGGTTDSGRPYFVMELVRGLPLTEYCDEERLSVHERLELFVQVCRAVQHAHLKGVIHRDLKPSNVLVTVIDGEPVPKVIDFGVAKATGQALTERTLFTGFAQLVGTPLYMSPEQAALSGMDIDTRSDIYSLGVLLYELLTGTTPFDQDAFRTAAFDEMRRIIREQEPPRPSTRLSSLGARRTSVSANRKADARYRDRAVRDELDWIVMKALEKDRRRRYETANDFASDVKRYLTDLPVVACPPSAGYRLQKFIRRNRGSVVAGVVLLALLVLGTVGTSVGLVWALQAETKAREEAAVATSVRDFLTEDLLAQASPELNDRTQKVTVEELLGRAASHLEGKFAAKPRVEAEIRLAIGDAYKALGELASAQPHLERAWELASKAFGEEHPRTLNIMNNLATLYFGQGRYADAEPFMIKLLEVTPRVLGEESSETLTCMNNVAGMFWAARKLNQSVPLFEEVLKKHRAVLGPKHAMTLSTMANLAVNYRDAGRSAEGTELLEQAWEMARQHPGKLDLDLEWIRRALAETYDRAGRFADSEPLHREALALARQRYGEASRQSAAAMDALGRSLLGQKKYIDAEHTLRPSVAFRVQQEPKNWKTSNARSLLGVSLMGQKKYQEAEPLLVAGYEGMNQKEAQEEIAATGQFRLTEAIERLVQLYESTGKKDQAAEWRAKLAETKSTKPAGTKSH